MKNSTAGYIFLCIFFSAKISSMQFHPFRHDFAICSFMPTPPCLSPCFTNDAKMDGQMDRWIEALSAVMRVQLRSIVMGEKNFSRKTKLSIYCLCSIPQLHYSYVIWIMIEMGFLWIVSGLSLRDNGWRERTLSVSHPHSSTSNAVSWKSSRNSFMVRRSLLAVAAVGKYWPAWCVSSSS